VAAVDEGDDPDADQVVDDREGEQVGADAVGQLPPDQGQHAQRERGIGGHRDAPAARRGVTGIDSQVDRDRHDHPAQPCHHRQGETASLAQFAHVELAAGLQASDQEEERHEPGVHPFAQALRQFAAARVNRQVRVPPGVVPRGVQVCPGQRHQSRRQQDRGAARLGAQELPQRRLQAPRPGGRPGELRCGRLWFRRWLRFRLGRLLLRWRRFRHGCGSVMPRILPASPLQPHQAHPAHSPGASGEASGRLHDHDCFFALCAGERS
jgi:hypothetical protein